jgi:hypothetical protein
MEHMGVRYELIQIAKPVGWKWIVHLSPTRTLSGFSSDEQARHLRCQARHRRALEDGKTKNK